MAGMPSVDWVRACRWSNITKPLLQLADRSGFRTGHTSQTFGNALSDIGQHLQGPISRCFALVVAHPDRFSSSMATTISSSRQPQRKYITRHWMNLDIDLDASINLDPVEWKQLFFVNSFDSLKMFSIGATFSLLAFLLLCPILSPIQAIAGVATIAIHYVTVGVMSMLFSGGLDDGMYAFLGRLSITR